MKNEDLIRAIEAANIDISTIVELTDVDPKTVQCWLKGRVPHSRHRKVLAKLLNVRENVLWPIDSTKEIRAVYAHRAEVPISAWWHLFSQAHQRIDLLGYAMSFLPEQHPRLVPLLKAKNMASCKIRIALADPTCRHVQERDVEEGLGGTLSDLIRSTIYLFRELWNIDGIDIRYHTTPLYNSIFRFDNEMFVTPHLYGLHGSKAPLFYLRRLEADGIFANFADHFEAVWKSAMVVEQV
jgi:hypothetical protein